MVGLITLSGHDDEQAVPTRNIDAPQMQNNIDTYTRQYPKDTTQSSSHESTARESQDAADVLWF